MELWSQLQIWWETGQWTQFLIYGVYTWVIMSPRSLGAGGTYCFQREYRFRPTLGYFVGTLFAGAAVLGALYAWQQAWLPRDLGQVVVVIGTIIWIATVIPPLGRALVRQLLWRTPYAEHIRRIEPGFDVKYIPEMQLVFITIFNPPDLGELDRNLARIRRNLEKTGGKFKIIAVVDGKGAYRNSDLAIKVAKKHCDVVGSGNAQRKRVNLKWMIKYCWKKGWVNKRNAHNVIMHFIDDDTEPHDDTVASRLIRHFLNPKMGGVTTAQYVKDPEGFWQHAMQVFESARNYGSQAFLTLFGAVGCLPGRWYAVRASYITPEFADYLASEMIGLPFGWTCFGLFPPRLRDPGDDRLITIQVQKNGGMTIMAPDAVVYTDTPKEFKKLWGMVTRWARSSNIYTVQETPWMVMTPATWPTLFLYWGNIGLAFGTVWIAGPYMVWRYLSGSRDILLFEALAWMFSSMAFTMMLRQLPLLVVSPWYIFFMLVLGFLGIMMQVAQVWGMLTFLKSKWTGVRTMGQGSTSAEISLDFDAEWMFVSRRRLLLTERYRV